VKIQETQLSEFFNTCLNAKTIKTLVKNASKVFEKMGFVEYFFHYIPHVGSEDYNLKKIFHVSKKHRAWLMDSFPEFINISPRDPFETFALKTGQSVWTGNLIHHEEFQSAEKQRFLKKITDHFGPSLLVPAYGPRRSRGYFFLSSESLTETPNIRDTAYIEYMCSLFHLKYTKLRTIGEKSLALTGREQDVLQLLPLGLSNREIGVILKISPHTVNGYIKQLFEKLDVTDRILLSQRAIALGLID